jgi:hypothetical protein
MTIRKIVIDDVELPEEIIILKGMYKGATNFRVVKVMKREGTKVFDIDWSEGRKNAFLYQSYIFPEEAKQLIYCTPKQFKKLKGFL